MGLEPTIFPLGGECVIHYATGTLCIYKIYGLRESNSGPTACEAVVITN